MASFLKKVQKGAQQVHKSRGQLASNIKQSFNQAKSLADEQIQQVLKVDYDRYLEKPLVLEGKIWKRRGGMAKYQNLKKQGESVWELRRFELRGNALLYYSLPPSDEEEIKFGGETSAPLDDKHHGGDDLPPTLADSTWSDKSSSIRMSNTEDPDDIDTPRGFIDFKEDKALVHVSPGHSAGAPSPFCLSIVTVTGVTLTTHHEKTKWMLSFDDQSTMMEWLTALSNVVALCSADTYNVQLVKAANPNRPANEPPLPFLRRPPVKEPPKKGSDNVQEETSTVQSASHQLWIAHSNYYVFRKDEEEEEEETKDNTTGEALPSMLGPKQQQQPPVVALRDMEKQHQKELQTLKASHEQYRQQMEQQVQELSQAASSNEEIAQEIQHLEQKEKQKAQSNQQDKAEIARLEQTIQELQASEAAQSNQDKAEIARLEQTIQELQTSEAVQSNEEDKAEIARLEQTIQELQTSEAAQSNEDKAEIARLDQKIQDLQSSEVARIEEVTKAAAIAHKMRQQQQDKEIAKLKQTIEQLQQQQEQLQKEQQSTDNATTNNEEATAAAAALEKQMEELQSAQAALAAQAEEMTKAQHEKQQQLQELKEEHQLAQQQLQTQVEELNKAAAATQQQHEQELADLQQTIEILQSAPPDEDDEFHDAM